MTPLKLATGTAIAMALIEIPLAQLYPTSPPTSTPTRMAIAGGAAFLAALAAGWLLSKR